MARSAQRGGVGPGNRRAGATAGRSAGRPVSATRRPSRSTRPAHGRPPDQPVSAPEPRRRIGSAPRAGERRRAAAAVRSPLARQIVALGLALCTVALSLAYPVRGYLQQQAAEAQALAEQQQLEEEIADRTAQIAALQDPAYIRAEAKRRLQYVTPGDTVYVVKVPAGASSSAGSPAESLTGEPDMTQTGAADGASASATDGAPAGGAEQPWYTSLWDTLSGGTG